MQEHFYIFFDFKLLDLGTFISDIIISICSFIFYLKIIKISSYEKLYLYYRYFFLFMSISTLIAAFAHLLFFYFGKELHLIAWFFTALSTYFFDRAVLINWNIKITKQIMWNFINIQLLIFVVLILLFKKFDIVAINTVISVGLFACPILFMMYFKQNQKGNLLILFGIHITILPALIFKSNFVFLDILTAKDISHLVIVVSLFFIYLGIVRNYKLNLV